METFILKTDKFVLSTTKHFRSCQCILRFHQFWPSTGITYM